MRPDASTVSPKSTRGSRVFARSRASVALGAVLLLSACATGSPAYHSIVMQGQVLSIDGDTVNVCVGERDGATVGQMQDVVRHVPNSSAPKAMTPAFRREDVGSVRIVSVFDEHYATAVVVSGRPVVSDTVEFERR